MSTDRPPLPPSAGAPDAVPPAAVAPAAVPPQDVPTIRRVVVVVAHPDDETLTAGGLLATLAATCEVVLVTCTRGERGEMIGADLAGLQEHPTELASYRTGELDRAVAALGLTDQLFLDTVDGGPRLVDSGMRWDDDAVYVRALPALDAGADAFSLAPLSRSVANLVKVLDRVQPDLVIVDEPGGGYGHPDHRRAHEVTMAAVEQAVQRPAFVAWPVRPRTGVLEAQRWLQQRSDLPSVGTENLPLALPDIDGPLPSIVVPDADADVAVDLTPALPAVAAAMRAHASQVQAVTLLDPAPTGPAAGWYALSNGVLQPLLRTGWLRVAPGWGSALELRAAITDAVGRPAPEPGRWYRPAMIVFALLLGAIVAAVGTAFHRTAQPWGLVVALLALVAGGVLARTFVDRAGQLAFGFAAIATVIAMTYVRPGGDVIVTGQPIGMAWIIGAVPASLLLPALVPRRALADGDG